MFYTFRARFNGGHWKVRMFVAPSSELTSQLTGTLTLSDAQWQNFKLTFLTRPMAQPQQVVITEEKEN